MRHIKATLSLLVAGALLAACSGSPASSGASNGASNPPASVAPSAPGVPIVELPALPAGWARYEVPGAFSIGVPEGWLVMTTVELNDPAAVTALKAAHPDYSTAIDSTLAQMREQNVLIQAFDIAGDTSLITSNMNIIKTTGPLNAAFATSAAAVVQTQFALETPLNVETVATPAGSYRYQFAESLDDHAMAGVQYLFASGSDVYVMTFLTIVSQAASYGSTVVSMADTFAASSGGAPAPVASSEPTEASSAPVSVGSPITVQGESATLQGAGQYSLVSNTSNTPDTHAGSLYLGDGGAQAVYGVEIPRDGTYTLWLRVNDDGLHPAGARSVSVNVGGATTEWADQGRDTQGWVYEAVGSIPITKGSLTVSFTKLATTSAAFSMDEFILSDNPDYQP